MHLLVKQVQVNRYYRRFKLALGKNHTSLNLKNNEFPQSKQFLKLMFNKKILIT